MTNEEAIRDLKKLRAFHNGSYGEACNMAISALEKQIPKKPNGEYPYYCPSCGHKMGIELFCSRCSQAIDWSEDNDKAR